MSRWLAVLSLGCRWVCGTADRYSGSRDSNYTVLPDTDFLGAVSYSKGRSIDDCAAQCLARPDCVATSWNGPQSHIHNNFCNFDCKTSGRRTLQGETAAIMLRRPGNLCAMPPPPPKPQRPLPSDWQQKKATGWLIAGTNPPMSPYLCPTYGNGFLAATICPGGGGESTGGVFLSGFFSGSCPAPTTKGAGNARATLPNVHDIVDIQNATYVGMALDIQNATVTRRFQLSGCQVDVSYFAHRSIRHLMVVSIAGLHFADGKACTIRPAPPTNGNGLKSQRCHTESGITTCNITAAVPETARQVPTTVAIHATALPPILSLSPATPEYLLVAAFATNLEPDIASKQHAIWSARERYSTVARHGVAELRSSHASGWATLWQSDLRIGGNISATASLRSSAYYILSSVRDDWAFGSSPGGLPSTS